MQINLTITSKGVSKSYRLDTANATPQAHLTYYDDAHLARALQHAVELMYPIPASANVREALLSVLAEMERRGQTTPDMNYPHRPRNST